MDKEGLEKEIDSLKENVSNYTDSDTINNILKSKKEKKQEYKIAKKEYKKEKRKNLKLNGIKNITFIGKNVLLILPFILSCGITLGAMDLMSIRPYIPDTYNKYSYTVYEVDNFGKDNVYTTYDKNLVDDKIVIKDPWYTNEKNYERKVTICSLSRNYNDPEDLKNIVNLDYDYLKENFYYDNTGSWHTEKKAELSEKELENIDKPYVNVVVETKNKDDFVKMKRDVGKTVAFSIIHVLINVGICFGGYYAMKDSLIVYSLNDKYKNLKNDTTKSNNEIEKKKKSLKQKKLQLKR